MVAPSSTPLYEPPSLQAPPKYCSPVPGIEDPRGGGGDHGEADAEGHRLLHDGRPRRLPVVRLPHLPLLRVGGHGSDFVKNLLNIYGIVKMEAKHL